MNDYTLRDVVNNLLIPRLDRIEQRIGTKAERQELEKVIRDVAVLKESVLDAQDVKNIIRDSLREVETRGWTRRERWIGLMVALVGLGTFVLAVVQLLKQH